MNKLYLFFYKMNKRQQSYTGNHLLISKIGVSDPYSSYADPDPAFLTNADPDPNPGLQNFIKTEKFLCFVN
jgi:hypothetical protein